MSASEIFSVTSEMTVEIIGRVIENFLENEKHLETISFKTNKGYCIRARDREKWKKFAGLGKALQVQVVPSGENEILVHISHRQWADKICTAAVGAFLFTPLIATAAFGTYKQTILSTEIFHCVDKFIVLHCGEEARVSFFNLKCKRCNSKIKKRVITYPASNSDDTCVIDCACPACGFHHKIKLVGRSLKNLQD